MNIYVLLYVKDSIIRPLLTKQNISDIQTAMYENYKKLIPSNWLDEYKNKSFIDDNQAVLYVDNNTTHKWQIIKLNIADILQAEKEENIITLIDTLDFGTKDRIFRHLHKNYLYDDFTQHCKSMNVKLTDEDLKSLCDKWVYQGRFDCNLSYWDNIENLINEIINNP